MVNAYWVEVFESWKAVTIFGISLPRMKMHAVLVLLSGIGLYISLYFTLVYYRLVDANTAFVPSLCRMDEGTCQLVIRHPDARLSGLPNSILGIGFYVLVMLVGIGVDGEVLFLFARWIAWAAVLLAVYLVYSLFFKMKRACPLCLVSHGISLAIALLLTT